MTKSAIQQALQTATTLARSGRAPEAESIYRQVLAAHPQQPAALFGYGLLLSAAGHAAAAVGLLRQAVVLQPNEADFRVGYAAAVAALGQVGEAEGALRRAVELRPSHALAHENLAVVLVAQGRLPEALSVGQRALALAPGSFNAACAVAQALVGMNRLEEGVAAAGRAITIATSAKPPVPAFRAFELAGHALMGLGRADEAIDAYKRSVSPEPGFAIAYSNLGNALQQRAKTEPALVALRMAIQLDPNLPDARNNYGNALKDLARLDEACDEYRLAVKLRPSTALFGSNLVYAMWFRQACDPAGVLAESRAWAAYHAEPLTLAAPPHTNDRNPDRRLRVGLVSPDFRFHPVGRLIQPFIAHHDKAQTELVLFSGVVRPDPLTELMYRDAAGVVDTRGMSDEQLAAAARQAGIDVLVDLQVHMSGTRLKAFALRPAPVQVTYLGYCSTTGMTGMDYVLTDRTLDPWDGPDPDGGAPSPIHSERLLHLDGCYWCYGEPPGLPETNPLPALANGGAVTFGSLNSFTKLNDGVLDVWTQLLKLVPTARLFLVVPGGADRMAEVAAMFVHRGIAADRLRMTDIVPARDYFLLYQNVDVALDPFPYAGGTTTMDALYMGVPVVTRAGRWATARAGVTLLNAAGLPQWIARTPDEYIQLAAGLASDLTVLAEWRQKLRPHLKRSALMDGPRFAADVERAFRRAWRHWCATGK
jgi:protein O-GlcNAc transferase